MQDQGLEPMLYWEESVSNSNTSHTLKALTMKKASEGWGTVDQNP